MHKGVRDLREYRDITQKQMAEFLQIHQTTYSDYELGNLNIPVEILIKLARFYETSIDYVGITDEITPYRRLKQENLYTDQCLLTELTTIKSIITCKNLRNNV